MCACACVYVRFVRSGEILEELKNFKITFIDFDVCILAATLPVLHSVTLIYFFKVKYFKYEYLENGES